MPTVHHLFTCVAVAHQHDLPHASMSAQWQSRGTQTTSPLTTICLQMRDEWAGVLDDWATRFFGEMDYQLEAYNTMTFKRQMAALEGIKVCDTISTSMARA